MIPFVMSSFTSVAVAPGTEGTISDTGPGAASRNHEARRQLLPDLGRRYHIAPRQTPVPSRTMPMASPGCVSDVLSTVV